MTSDVKAVHHVLFNSYDYPKPEVIRYILSGFFGSGAFCCMNWGDIVMTFYIYIGVLTVEGDEHKHQVRIFFLDLFANCCLILQLAQDLGQLICSVPVG